MTRTVPEFLNDIMEAFFVRYPFLASMITEYKGASLRFLKEYLTSIDTLPTVTNYSQTEGWFPAANTQNGRDLQTDVKIQVDQWPIVPLKWLQFESVQDDQQKYDSLLAGAAEALAKHLVNTIIGRSTADNFSQATAVAAINVDYDVLSDVTTGMNVKGAGEERYMLVNSAVAGALAGDDRMNSSLFVGQMQKSAYRRWNNVAGWTAVIEHPSMPTAGNLIGMGFERRAFAFIQGISENMDKLREWLGAPEAIKIMPMRHKSGMTMASAAEQARGTGDVKWAVGCMLGVHAGRGTELVPANSGIVGALTDFGGHRLVSA